jgi:hypothetical protein
MNERAECRAEERFAFLWSRVRGHVYALANVLPEIAQREHEVEGILEP